MRSACLINHYNYGKFIGDAVASVLAQTRPVDEILLVDDGSCETDLALVREAAAQSDLVRLIEKPNGGQLSCFEAGVAAADSDVLFFLDADDLWEPTYVETALAVFETRPDIDLVGSNMTRFYTDGTEEHDAAPSRSLGYTTVRCLEMKGLWMGSVTSCLAIRKDIIDKIFPTPNPTAWRVCADEMLVYGSSMAGAQMYFQGEPLVRYRVHGDNAFFGTKDTPQRSYARRMEARRLVEHLRQKFYLPESLAESVSYEFRTIENPTRKEYDECWRILRQSSLSLRRKIDLRMRLFGYFRLGHGKVPTAP